MSRPYATVAERVRQVRDFGLPYWAFVGKPGLNNRKSIGLLQLGETVTPEFVVEGSSVSQNAKILGLENMHHHFQPELIPILNASMGKDFKRKKYFQGFDEIYISGSSLEIHFIYDSIADITHCFVFPNRKELEKR